MEDRTGEIGNLQDKAEIRRRRHAALGALEARIMAEGWEINPARADEGRVIWRSPSRNIGVSVPQDVDASDFDVMLDHADRRFDPEGWDPYRLRERNAELVQLLGHALDVGREHMDRDCVFCADIGRELGLDLTNQFDELDPPTTDGDRDA